MKKISAEIVADSINQQGDRITTYLLTFPRFILAELNTHRVFSKNSASSRAIPFKKMVKMVEEDPFIPIAWQKNHSGMQGTEYLSKTDKYNLASFIGAMSTTLHSMIKGSEEYDKLSKELDEKVEVIETLLIQYATMAKTLDEWWLFARDKAVEAASIMYVFGVTKQLCNRLLEPFMWHTVLLTATEFENFFELRCPQYLAPENSIETKGRIFKSKKDMIQFYTDNGFKIGAGALKLWTSIDWLKANQSQAEIHMQALAEAMWDAMNESTPKELEEGEYHIPFGDRIDLSHSSVDRFKYEERGLTENEMNLLELKISTARCARLSYMTFDGEIDYEKDLKLHDTLLESQHMSPFEHCARAMTNEEYDEFYKGRLVNKEFTFAKGYAVNYLIGSGNEEDSGWCNNFRGFIQYRHLIEN